MSGRPRNDSRTANSPFTVGAGSQPQIVEAWNAGRHPTSPAPRPPAGPSPRPRSWGLGLAQPGVVHSGPWCSSVQPSSAFDSPQGGEDEVEVVPPPAVITDVGVVTVGVAARTPPPPCAWYSVEGHRGVLPGRVSPRPSSSHLSLPVRVGGAQVLHRSRSGTTLTGCVVRRSGPGLQHRRAGVLVLTPSSLDLQDVRDMISLWCSASLG